MDLDIEKNSVALKFDARNKESKNYRFFKVCDGETSQKAFFDAIKVNEMVSNVVKGYHATIFAYG